MTRRRPNARSFVSALGGATLALVVGAGLLVTGLVGAGHTTTEVVAPKTETRVASSGSSDRSVGDVYRSASPGVVYIQSRSPGSDSPFGGASQASGSGFVLDREGHILTNEHVVDGAGSVQVRFGAGGRLLDARVVGSDASTDLAVIKVDPSKAELHPLPLGDSSKLRVGDETIAIGNPYGYDRTVTSGIVSALGRHIRAPNDVTIAGAIQTDAAINPGNSGGPLLDADGKVIGITSQIATGSASSGSTGVGFAVPIDTAKSMLGQLEAGKNVS
jgi:putative serine protease PepD